MVFEDLRQELEVFLAERGELDIVDLTLIGREAPQQRICPSR